MVMNFIGDESHGIEFVAKSPNETNPSQRFLLSRHDFVDPLIPAGLEKTQSWWLSRPSKEKNM